MIKAIIFDWGGVLIKDCSTARLNYCASKLGVNANKLKIEFQKYEKDFWKNKLTELELWEKICKKLEVSVPKPSSIWLNALKKFIIENKKVIKVVRELKKQGYLLGFLSNTEIPSVEYFKKQKYNIFDILVFSCMEGYVKPEKEIYEIALNKLGVRPEEAIFIDDKEAHIKGAKKLGISTILFTSAENLIKELQKFGVNVG